MSNEHNGGVVSTREQVRRGFPPLTEDMERFFQQAARGLPVLFPTHRSGRPWITDQSFPEIDVVDHDGKLVIRADLPGMRPEDINVHVDGDFLVIRGRREEKEDFKDARHYRSERHTGEFERAVNLPVGVSPDAIDAAYENGVLEVTVTRPATSAPKPIDVHVN